MKTWKLVSGILSIVLSVFVIFQALIVGMGNTLAQNGDVSGGIGLFVALLMLAGGIVSIVTRNGGKESNIAILIIFGIAGWLAFSYKTTYPDLAIWGGWCAICAFLGWAAAASTTIKKYKDDPNSIDFGNLNKRE